MADTEPQAKSRNHEGLDRVVFFSILANVGFAALKGLAGVLGHSYALIADALESVMDIGKSLVVLGGVRLASTPPDEKHPYGHGKAEPLAAMVVALSLVAGAAGLAIQSVRHMLEPQTAPSAYTLIVLLFVVLAKEGIYRYLSKRASGAGSCAVEADAWEHRSDAITSAGAFVGISIAVVGKAAGVPACAVADDWAALFACVVIAYNGIRILWPALAEVMDTAPEPELIMAIESEAREVPGVSDLHNCLVRKMGYDLFVDVHVLVDGSLSVREGHRTAHAVKHAIRTKFPQVRDVLIHIEPNDLPWARVNTKGDEKVDTLLSLGVQSWSFRNFDTAGALEKLKELGLTRMEFCNRHFPPDKNDPGFAAVKKQLAGITVPCFGVEGFGTDEAKARARFEFAKAFGVGVLAADPEPAALDYLEELCAEYNVAIAIHNHGPESRYNKVEDTLKAVQGRHPLLGACVDTGHALRSSEQPHEVIRALGDRVIAVHLKDWIVGGKEQTVGEGDMDLKAVVQALRDIKFSGPISLEYEENPENPVPAMKRGVANWRAAVEAVK